MKTYQVSLTEEQIKHIYEALAFASSCDVCADWPDELSDGESKLNVMKDINSQIKSEVNLDNSKVYIYSKDSTTWCEEKINEELISEFNIRVDD